MKGSRLSGRVILFLLIGGIVMTSLSGCGRTKYQVLFAHGGFKTARTRYAPGEPVEIGYMIASDTDYRFSVDGAAYEQDFDPKRGMMILRFTMPEHDVTVDVTWENNMTVDPNANTGFAPLGTSADPAGLAEGQWICPDCGETNEGKYCAQCGRKKPDADEAGNRP